MLRIDEEEDDFDNSIQIEKQLDKETLLPKPTIRSFGSYYDGIVGNRKLFKNNNNKKNDEQLDDEGDYDVLDAASSSFQHVDGVDENFEELRYDVSEESMEKETDFSLKSSDLHRSHANEEINNAKRLLIQKKTWTLLVQGRLSLSTLISLINRLSFSVLSLLQSSSSISPALASSLERAKKSSILLLCTLLNTYHSYIHSLLKKFKKDNHKLSPTSSLTSIHSSFFTLSSKLHEWVLKTADEAHSQAVYARVLMQSNTMRNLNLPLSQQVRNIMGDKERMLERVHVDRVSAERVIIKGGRKGEEEKEEDGDDEKEKNEEEEEEEKFSSYFKRKKKINTEIIDDNDFLQVLLQSVTSSSTNIIHSSSFLISNKDLSSSSSSPNFPEFSNAQQALLTTLRLQRRQKQEDLKKGKKLAESKGRAVKYIVHPQLVSFMAPSGKYAQLNNNQDSFPRNTDVVMSNLFGVK